MKTRGMVCLFLLASSAASAQTFDFTGVITSTINDGIPYNPVAVGSTVTGSFTLDFANAQSVTGKVGSANWSVNEASVPPNPGIFPTSAPPTVFALTLQAGSFTYSSVPSDESAFNDSSIAGHHGVFSASEDANPAGVGIYGRDASSITLNGYGPAGVPGPHVQGVGQLTEGLMGSFYDVQNFSIRSVSRVAPEIDPSLAASSCVLLLCALAVLRGGRRMARSRPG
jgi:hypothetical protein